MALIEPDGSVSRPGEKYDERWRHTRLVELRCLGPLRHRRAAVHKEVTAYDEAVLKAFGETGLAIHEPIRRSSVRPITFGRRRRLYSTRNL
jgi:hypothetical protein